MVDDNSETLALLAESMRAADHDREENMRRFERLTEVMVNGFLRLEDKLGARIDRVAAEVVEVKTDIREIKVQAQEANRRRGNAFTQVGQLTGAVDDSQLRLVRVEQARQPTNAELDARLRAVEDQLRHAS